MNLLSMHDTLKKQEKLRTTLPSRYPIKAFSNKKNPIIAVNRWMLKTVGERKFLEKCYTFRRHEDKSKFINEILNYEVEIGHNAQIEIGFEEQEYVLLRLWTHQIDIVTELDREYAKFADVLYKDILYS